MQSWPTRTEKRPTMSQHDFSAVVAALEAAAAERRTALDLLIAASDRASRMADAQARVAEAPSRVAIFVGHGKRALWLGTALSVVLLAGGVAARIAHPAFLGPAALTGLSDAISSSPNSAPDLGRLPKPESAPDTATSYTIFRDRTVNGVPLTAGHLYFESGDQIWAEAWCYTELPGRQSARPSRSIWQTAKRPTRQSPTPRICRAGQL